jgi:hypothetical protein
VPLAIISPILPGLNYESDKYGYGFDGEHLVRIDDGVTFDQVWFALAILRLEDFSPELFTSVHKQ